jgi:AraC-like DNA-binding protein
MIPFMHIGIAFALFTVIYFQTRRPLKLNDVIASLFLFFLALSMVIRVVNREGAGISTPEMLLSIGSCPFLYGPFLYLYTKFEISERPVFKKGYLLHFLPFIISLVLVFFFPGLYQQARALNLKNNAGHGIRQGTMDRGPRSESGGREAKPPPMPGEKGMMPPPKPDGREMMLPRPGEPGGWGPPPEPGPGDLRHRPPVPPGPDMNSLAVSQVPGAVTVTYFVTYTVLILLMLRRHRKNISDYFSYDSFKVNLEWLRWLTICYFLAYVFVLLSLRIKPELFAHRFLDPRMTPDIALSFFIFAFSFFAVKQPVIFARPGPEEKKGAVPAGGGEKVNAVMIPVSDGGVTGDGSRSDQKERRYEKSGLKEADAMNYLQALDRYMKEEKPYLDSGLTILTVSERLGIPRHYLTQAINAYLNKNFFVYINEFRVSEAKQRMSDEHYRDHTILRIAYDSGFNSKSGFNNIFKKHTGFTPTEYRNSCG